MKIFTPRRFFSALSILLLSAALPIHSAEEEKKLNPVRSNIPRLRLLDFSPFTESLSRLNDERLAAVTRMIRQNSIPALQKAMAAREVTSEELTLCLLSRIQRYDEHLRSYIELNPHCLEEARQADRWRAAGQVRGPMHGIPLSVKDNIGTTAPLHTTVGAEILRDHSPARDAALVTQLRESGAVILGKASLSELAGVLTTDPAGYNAISGMGRNPHGQEHPVSGSSSGSAISTSACLALVSVGTETSGSLISPASMNGVVAMKPSLGAVSSEGVVPLIRFQDSAGPVARCVTDAALLLAVMDTHAVDYAEGLDPKALEGVPVGVLRAGILGKSPAPEQADWLRLIDKGLNAAKAVSRDVGELFDNKPPLLPVIVLGLSRETIAYMAAAGAPVKTVADLRAYNLAEPQTRIPRRQNMIDLATQIMGAIVKESGIPEESVGQLYEEFALEIRKTDATLLATAFASNEVEVLVSLGNTHSEVYATAGYPAVTVPLGVNAKGAPNGVTFIGKQGQDARLLAFAFAFEQATHYHKHPEATLQ